MGTSSLNRTQWNQLAAEFEDSVCDLTATDLNRQVQKLMKHVVLPDSDARLVDLGCGCLLYTSDAADE